MNTEPACDVEGLEALARDVRRDLERLTLPSPRWVPDRSVDGETLLDVAVVGAGMAGLAAAASLRHAGIGVVNFDRQPAGLEGPWATSARMRTLRSPKTLTGPALGIPSLTFRAWFEAQFGRAAWDALDKIPRLMWMDYLRWYRQVLGLDIRNDHRVEAIRLAPDHVRLEIEAPAGHLRVLARHLVLATGRDGLGGPYLPPQVAKLPRERWAHSSDLNDYAELAGRRVAVIGAGASAMDSAGTALEAGAARVDLLIRRKELPRVNRGKGMGNPGSVLGYVHLPDAWKWRIQSYIAGEQVPPPRNSVLRVAGHANAYFHQDCTFVDARMEGGEIAIETSKGVFRVDFVIFSTGFQVDWRRRPMLAEIARCARIWADRYPQGLGTPQAALLEMPDLGPAFEFQPKEPGGCPGIERVHCFCYPAMMSHGTVSGDIPAISDGAERLTRALAASLYAEDIETHFQRGRDYDEPEILGDEWVPAEGGPLAGAAP